MTRPRRSRAMRPVDWLWVAVWIAAALGARWWFTGLPPWPGG